MTQPFLHDAEVVLRAPAQLWARSDGSITSGIDGLYVSDVRVLSQLDLRVAGTAVEHVRGDRARADRVRLTGLLRGLDDAGADPRVRLDRDRRVTADGMTEMLRVASGRDVPVEVDLELVLAADLATMPVVKSGGRGERHDVRLRDGAATWAGGSVRASLTVQGLDAEADGALLRLRWRTTVPPRGSVTASWTLRAHDDAAVVRAPEDRIPLPVPASGLPDLDRWLESARADLESLQLALPDAPDAVFLAAGAPWFFTLFGRDSIWAARMLLPTGLDLAAGTLKVLARLQGERTDTETGERPGGILHELRRDVNPLHSGMVLPPRYYGTIDATPLWILLLHDAWRAGLDDATVRELLPNLRRALAWLEQAVPEGGFLAYHDESGHGLANQGWKDSGDSIRWSDGRLATGPIALCEVQAYAHEAALAAVVLLTAFGAQDEAAHWSAWAAALKARFRDAFWVDDGEGGHPAVALDAHGAAVDSLTSNIGHLLGTGLLASVDEDRVAALLVDPRLDSGYGLRTLAADSGGYWPLSYHCGSVWAHDTAIAVHGLLRSGHADEAAELAAGLVRAAAAFGFRMPELHGGDPAVAGAPVPYPAACRPQAWSAAAAVVAHAALAPEPSRPTAPAGAVEASATNQ
ncbi:glycogen debranching N-terminal domain-containing protein [Amnibacterium sp.]|uniref:glycogen debranching N-terminal domain-containing protein n=1 Tax=Amnibacterium sp. TaxID=1872496 RepID=UPI00261EA48F|nr:glycogen debranching N-terminal domain-containing protein [Amnibacterium sp.]MCU1473091.1 amylo-alpha,6-glucosidase [Amnibacterium sp.]